MSYANISDRRSACNKWYAENSEYQKSRALKVYREAQDKTSGGKNHGKPYTEADDAILSSSEYTALEAALILGRGYGSILKRRGRIRQKNYDAGGRYALEGE